MIGTYSSIVLKNQEKTITKEMAFLAQFISINSIDFKIDNDTFIINNKNNIPFTEYHLNVETCHTNAKKVVNSDLISFFLASPDGNYHTETIDFEALANENIEIPKEYDFNHLIPPVELYKEIIDEYCAIMDPRKLASLQKQISDLNSGLAKARIHSHLSYKLGTALIQNSKSILGYIRMPFVLSYIKDKHKKEQKAYEVKIKENPNLALPPLESYADYNEALKEKECFTYKLGQAFIKAHKNWYGGGYIKFLLKDVPRLKREFGEKQKS